MKFSFKQVEMKKNFFIIKIIVFQNTKRSILDRCFLQRRETMKKPFYRKLTIFAAACYLLQVGATTSNGAEVNPQYENRSDIPSQYTWKLEEIYPNQKSWDKDVKSVVSQADQFYRYKGTLSKSASHLKNILEQYSTIMRKHDKIYIYASLKLHTNASNADLQSSTDQADHMSMNVMEKTSWLYTDISKLPTKKLKTYINDPQLSAYKYVLEEMMRTKEHTLPEKMEELLLKTAPIASVPESTFTMLEKDIPFPSFMAASKTALPLNRFNYSTYMESSDRVIREKAFQTYYHTLKQYQDTFAQTLGGQVKASNAYAKIRHYPNAIAASLDSNNIPVRVYGGLIQSVHRGLPLLHRYMAVKKQLLHVSPMHMYDLRAPLSKKDNQYVSFEEAKKRVIDGLSIWGEDYTDVLTKAFNERWIDVYSTQDKHGGAYQWGSYDTHPYVLLNYRGTNDDVSTIAHELGHAMQSYYTKKAQPYLTAGYPTFLAEIASTMNEQLLWHDTYKKAKTKEEKIALLCDRLEGFRTTLFRQTQFAEFEKIIHEKDQQGESLNAEAMSNIYLELNKKYYGPSIVSDPEIAVEWAKIPHLYNNFYVYQYATSFAASIDLTEQILKEGRPAINRIHHHLLTAGGSENPLFILKKSGVDMSTDQPIREAMKAFDETLTELENLLK